jgi:hypothetical protein
MLNGIEMAIVFECIDVRGRIVRLHDRTWFDKILADHEDLIGDEDTLQEALRDPDVRTRDKTFANCEVYYRSGVFNDPYGYDILKIVVEFSDENGELAGRIVTAYPVDRVHVGETRIWTRTNIQLS